MTIDNSVYALAVMRLSDHPESNEDAILSLAEAIQRAIEDWEGDHAAR